MSHTMSFAQALNEAKQVILQQSTRIKSDGEKLRGQQQTIVEQSGLIAEGERKLSEHAAALEERADELRTLAAKYDAETSARAQAEAVVNRQGERITMLETTSADAHRRIDEQADRIDELTRERDALRSQMPTVDDEAALASLAALLTKKAPVKMRLVGEAHAEAA